MAVARSTTANARHLTSLRAKVQAKGYRRLYGWVSSAERDAAFQRARLLNIGVQTLVSAAISAGLRSLTTTEILVADKRWHDVVGYPVMPGWPGARHDPSLRNWKALKEGRRILHAKQRAAK